MIPLALALIVVGLVMAFLSGSVNRVPLLAAVVFWVGVVLVIVGLVLLLAPVILWLDVQIRAMIR